MTGFKDRLKDALSDFVEFDEQGQPKQPAAGGDAGAAAAPAPRPVAAPVATGGAPGVFDPAMLATLQQAVAQSTQPGYDYFRTLFDAMDGVPDESLRYSLALKAVQASHKIGPQAVLASIDDRLRLLEKEQGKFESALARETTTTVGGANDEIKSIAAAIAAKQAEIKELQARQTALADKARSAQAELDRSRADFAAAYGSVHATLDAERARIAAHLPPAK